MDQSLTAIRNLLSPTVQLFSDFRHPTAECHIRKSGMKMGKGRTNRPWGLLKPGRNFCLACLTYFMLECFSANAPERTPRFPGCHHQPPTAILVRIITISRFYGSNHFSIRFTLVVHGKHC